jgi:hypothetical protein
VNRDTSGSDAHRAYLAEDPKARTGFGLALVREAAEALCWKVAAGRSAEGGALLLLALPRIAERDPSSAAVSSMNGFGLRQETSS